MEAARSLFGAFTLSIAFASFGPLNAEIFVADADLNNAWSPQWMAVRSVA